MYGFMYLVHDFSPALSLTFPLLSPSLQAIDSPLNSLLPPLKGVSPPLQPPHKPKANTVSTAHTTQLAATNSSTCLPTL